MEAHADESAEGANRRVSRRNRTLKKATISFNGGYSAFDCVVRNLSESGAMLQVSSLGIPSHFELKMDAASARRSCTVRWRTESAIGVSFDDADPTVA